MDFRIAQKLMLHESLPTVLVDLDAFDRNIHKATKSAHPHPIRLATKSLRVPELIRRTLASSPQFQGLMCYSAKEMELLAGQGFDNMLLAYPTVQTSDLQILHKLHQTGKKIYLVVDSLGHLNALGKFLKQNPVDLPLKLILEVDASLRLLGGKIHLGVRRSQVRTIPQALQFIENLRLLPESGFFKLAGVMMYEAQVAGLTDRNPFNRLRNPVAHLIRIFSAQRLKTFRKQLRTDLEDKLGHRLEIFNGGGTGSLSFNQTEDALSEVTMGSGLLCSHLFDYYSDAKYEPACFFVSQVVRNSDPDWITVQGGGYIASGSPGWDRWPRPWWPKDLQLTDMEGAGEVQTPLKILGHERPLLGDAIFFRHAKAGELAERFSEYLLYENNRISGQAPTYRGLGLCTY